MRCTPVMAQIKPVSHSTTKSAIDTVQINFDKPTALIILKGLQIAGQTTSQSKEISAFDGTQSQNVLGFFISNIYRKWPDLIPKQPGSKSGQ